MSTVKKFEKQPVIPDPPNTRTDTKAAFLQKADAFNPALKAWADSFNDTVIDNLNALVDVLNQQLPYINTVSDADAAIRAVYTALAQVNTVSAGMDSVNACATWMDKIKLVAENMAEIVAAKGYAEEAKKWALMAEAVVNVKPATKETLGLIMVGAGLEIDLKGTLNVAPDKISSTTAGGVITVKDVAIGGNLEDLASARGQIGNAVIVGTVDFNTLVKQGVYSPAANSTNGPNWSGQQVIVVYQRNVANQGRRVVQYAFNATTNAAAMRIGLFTTGTEETPTSWSNWTKIISENSIGDGIRDTNGIISVPEYEGATASTSGTSGLVPPAAAGQQESFLTGGGEYKPALTKISDATDSIDSTVAASSKAVKSAYDRGSEGVSKATAAQNSANNALSVANGKQANLGFTPVQQGGGTGQGTNKVYIGWATDASGLKAQADSTNLGNIVTTEGGTIKAPQAVLADRAEVATNADKLGVSGWGYTSWNSTPYTVSPLYLWCLPTGGSDMQPCSPSVLSVYSTEVTPNVRVGTDGSVLPPKGTWRCITSRNGEGEIFDLAGGSAVNTKGGVFMAIRVA